MASVQDDPNADAARAALHGRNLRRADAHRARDEQARAQAAADAERVAVIYAELLRRTPENDMQPRLDPVRMACDVIGDPQRAYPVIHLTGTNGKTSTARMIEAVLREHNLRTGRYTSPHLVSVTERLSIDGEPISDAAFADVYEQIAPMLAMVDNTLIDDGQVPLTYFEVLTVLAFAAFADAPVDVAVIEVGLGGTWDATNVADGAVCVVTPIGLDHTDLLGDTVADIAEEKAGIFNEGCHAVLADQPGDAAEVLLRRGVETGSTISREGLEFAVEQRTPAVGGQVVTVRGLAGEYRDLMLPLLGAHQAQNLAVAVAACEAFLGNGTQALDTAVLAAGLAQVSSPGRLEIVRHGPTVVLDAAHNVAGAQALVDGLEDSLHFERLVGVIGVLHGKDADGILGVLEPVVDEVVITRSSSPRAIDVDELAELAEDVFGEDRVHRADRLDEAVVTAIDLAEAASDVGAGVLITGSITVVGEARLLLGGAHPEAGEQAR